MHLGELQWSESSSHVVASAHAPDLPLQQQPSFSILSSSTFLISFPTLPGPAVAVRQMGNGTASCCPGDVLSSRKCWSLRTHIAMLCSPLKPCTSDIMIPNSHPKIPRESRKGPFLCSDTSSFLFQLVDKKDWLIRSEVSCKQSSHCQSTRHPHATQHSKSDMKIYS